MNMNVGDHWPMRRLPPAGRGAVGKVRSVSKDDRRQKKRSRKQGLLQDVVTLRSRKGKRGSK